jgi:purine nucleoside permease
MESPQVKIDIYLLHGVNNSTDNLLVRPSVLAMKVVARWQVWK